MWHSCRFLEADAGARVAWGIEVTVVAIGCAPAAAQPSPGSGSTTRTRRRLAAVLRVGLGVAWQRFYDSDSAAELMAVSSLRTPRPSRWQCLAFGLRGRADGSV